MLFNLTHPVMSIRHHFRVRTELLKLKIQLV